MMNGYRAPGPLALILALLCALTACEPRPVASTWAPPGGLFVVTTDYATGSFSIVDTETLQTYNDAGLKRIHYDAVARHFPSMPDFVYIINRFLKDNVQILDRHDSYSTVAQESTGNGSNPQDMVVIDAGRAYVTRYNRGELWIIDPATALKTGEIDLSAYAHASASGVPYMSRMFHYTQSGRNIVFVALQRLNDAMAPSDYSLVIAIQADPASPDRDSVIAEIPLGWDGHSARNPYTAFRHAPAAWWQPPIPDGNDHLFISCVGRFGYDFALDGGIVAIDCVDMHCEEGYVLSEATAQCEITDFVVKSGQSAYATTSDSAFASGLIQFNPETGAVTSTIRRDNGNWGYLWSLLLHPSGVLYVCDRNALNPGLRIYDTNLDNTPLNGNRPLYTGLPPFDLELIE